MENLVDIPQLDYSSVVQNKTFEVTLFLKKQMCNVKSYKILAISLEAAMAEVKKELSFGSIGFTSTQKISENDNNNEFGTIVPMYSIESISVHEVNE